MPPRSNIVGLHSQGQGCWRLLDLPGRIPIGQVPCARCWSRGYFLSHATNMPSDLQDAAKLEKKENHERTKREKGNRNVPFMAGEFCLDYFPFVIRFCLRLGRVKRGREERGELT